MSEKRYRPVTITPNFHQLGIPSFPAYLSMGEDGMIIEGGTGATFPIIVDQIKELGIEPEQIKYLALTHTHADHIGAVPHLKKLWPHLKVVGSPVAVKMLGRISEKEEALKEFLWIDRSIAEILLSKGEIAVLPPEADNYTFGVDVVVQEGDSLDLGSGVVWAIYDTPGHSPCHISLYNEREGTLDIGDVTGFYDPKKNVFWPNYFESLETYCNSIRKVSTLPASRVVLSHNCVVERGVSEYFQKAMRATESYHLDMLEKLGKGVDPEEIALEKAKWVNSFTDLQPFEVIHSLTKLMLRRSQSEADKENLFATP